ncbi:MAG: tRNA uridine-5-carboxymethylaminomethyl(34) synthesis GTPase MnmE [Leptonema sp. (in: bacteria)]
MHTEDTIISLSSPPGRGAIGIIRISGKNTKSILNLIAKTPNNQKINTLHPRKLQRALFYLDGEWIDDGMFVYFHSPFSYTGEDMAELYIHGNPLIAKKIISFVSLKGLARPSLPGEFTRRAFLNGKIDLTKAESINRIIQAKSEFELNSLKKIYFGDLYKLIHKIRSEILLLKANLEAEIDFSDQDIEYTEKEVLIQKVYEIKNKIQNLLENSSLVSKISQGIQISLVGKTNAGKSSLMNKILGWDRSIVSEVEGTTRDYISEEMEIAGILVRIVDTAGLRVTYDKIEQEGIKRTKEAMERSFLILHIIDGSLPKYEFTEEITKFLKKNHNKILVHIINKKDTLHKDSWKIEDFIQDQNTKVIYTSCKTGEGLLELKNLIEELIQNHYQVTDPYLLEERQYYHFNKILESLEKILTLWNQNAPEEILSVELNYAIEHLAELTGEVTTEEILGKIFSMFCIGK